MDMKKYPRNWKEISRFIRFERADNKCEQCGVQNGFLKFRSSSLANGFEIVNPKNQARIHELESRLCDLSYSVTKIVLTVAHLDHEGGPCDCFRRTGKKCGNAEHLLALCQACHLKLDMPKHIACARRTRTKKKDSSRGLFSILEKEL
jgi:hypothetical protein